MIKEVPITTIDPKSLEPTNPDRVKSLAEKLRSGVPLLNPITVTKDMKVIAGSHRYRAARLAGKTKILVHIVDLTPRLQEIASIDENIERKTFTVLELGDLLERRKRLYEDEFPEAKHGGDRSKTRSSRLESFAKVAADATGKRERTIQQYVQVAKKIAPKAKKALAKTKAADDLTGLTKLAKLEPEHQVAVAERVAETGESVKRAAQALKRAEQDKKVAAYVPAEGVFQMHTLDFSWPYRDKREGNDDQRGLDYPPQTLEEIVAFIRGPLAKGCDPKGCVIGNWMTGPISIDSSIAPVVQREYEALGFKMIHERIWKKTRSTGGQYIGQGTGIRWDAEKLQIYVRGDVAMTETGEEHGTPIQQTVFEAPVGKHSEKPQKAYDDLEALFPRLTKRLEHHARAPREGWATTGPELEPKPAAAPSSPPPTPEPKPAEPEGLAAELARKDARGMAVGRYPLNWSRPRGEYPMAVGPSGCIYKITKHRKGLALNSVSQTFPDGRPGSGADLVSISQCEARAEEWEQIQVERRAADQRATAKKPRRESMHVRDCKGCPDCTPPRAEQAPTQPLIAWADKQHHTNVAVGQAMPSGRRYAIDQLRNPKGSKQERVFRWFCITDGASSLADYETAIEAKAGAEVVEQDWQRMNASRKAGAA